MDLLERTRARLGVGAQEYGDASYTRPPTELIEEARQELADVIGWLAIAWAADRGVRMPDAFDAFLECARHPGSHLELMCGAMLLVITQADEGLAIAQADEARG